MQDLTTKHCPLHSDVPARPLQENRLQSALHVHPHVVLLKPQHCHAVPAINFAGDQYCKPKNCRQGLQCTAEVLLKY